MSKRRSGQRHDSRVRRAILGHASTGRPGETLFGRYEAVAFVGRGGMGEVYLARIRDAPEFQLVALKVLHDPGEDEDVLAMFIDEASIMARIDHPNVLRVFDFGKEEGAYFLAMEYLQGRPLAQLMVEAYDRIRGLDYGIIASIGADVARGLSAAHAAKGKRGQRLNVVHRDVSPQNIFITFDGVAKVIDFGVARATERLTQTAVGEVKGKAAYMSPEQIATPDVDGRSDVFALGICLWEMTSGRRLFKRSNEYETMEAVKSGPILPPTRVRKAPDKDLDSIIMRALERDLRRRTPSAKDLELQLTRYARKSGMAGDGSELVKLMSQLFGDEAKQEKDLIRSIQEGTRALDEETFRKVSGISVGIGGDITTREVTLAGNPTALLDLEEFGEDTTTDSESDAISVREFAPLVSPAERAEKIEKAVESLSSEVSEVRRKIRKKRRKREEIVPLSLIGLILLGGIVAVGVSIRNFDTKKTVAPDAQAQKPAPRPPLPEQLLLKDAGRLLERMGVRVYPSGDDFELEAKVRVKLHADASLVKTELFGQVGYLVIEPREGRSSVLFIGNERDAVRWKITALSVSDCPARAEIQEGRAVIFYGEQKTEVSGTDELRDIEVSVPTFADRMELSPLGLSFGVVREDFSGVHCPLGWKGDKVELLRLPLGRYTLRFTGAEKEKETKLDVEK